MAYCILSFIYQEKGAYYEPHPAIIGHHPEPTQNLLYPTAPTAIRFITGIGRTAVLVSGIVSHRPMNLPYMAAKALAGARAQSRVKRFSCWLNNERIDLETYFLPSATYIYWKV